MKKVLIVGSTGYLGSYLYKSLINDGYTVRGVSRRGGMGHESVDATQFEHLFKLVKDFEPEVIINSSGTPSVDLVGRSPLKHFRCDFEVAKNIVMSVKKLDKQIKVIHFSTIYVYGLESESNYEYQAPSPVNLYGFSKLLAESFLISSISTAISIRLPMLIGNPCEKDFFIRNYNRLKAGGVVTLSDEAIRCPLDVSDVYRAFRKILEKDLAGLLNLCGNEQLSKYKMMKEFIERFFPEGLKGLKKLSSSEEALDSAFRPQNLVMNSNVDFLKTFNFKSFNLSLEDSYDGRWNGEGS